MPLALGNNAVQMTCTQMETAIQDRRKWIESSRQPMLHLEHKGSVKDIHAISLSKGDVHWISCHLQQFMYVQCILQNVIASNSDTLKIIIRFTSTQSL
jgi:hypothetical protein